MSEQAERTGIEGWSEQHEEDLDPRALLRPESWQREPTRQVQGLKRWSEQTDRPEAGSSLHELMLTSITVARRRPGRTLRSRLSERFAALAEVWRQETLLESSLTRMAMHKAYQQIIGLGMPAVPLILKELEREPNYWFWALTSITGQDPAAGEDTLEGATERWLEWGHTNGLLA